jgi:uracil-DNA glycosylase
MGHYYTEVGSASLNALVKEAKACTACADRLPHAPRPIFLVGRTARLLIVGQAPGRRVHESGLPWNDPSGDVLRAWLGMDRATFYDTARIAIVPVGLCYPGTVGGVDLPPCRECAPRWQPRFRAALPGIGLTLLVGAYAQAYYLQRARKASVGETVRRWRDYAPDFFPLPHPSWRNRAWLSRNPWFERDVIPALRRRVKRSIAAAAAFRKV